MNIYATPGSRIIFAYPENGRESDQELAKKHLKPGELYTIERTDVGDWHTDVCLTEIPGVWFNLVHFEDFVLRAEVLWFAGEMERQLRAHDEAKGRRGWVDLSIGDLCNLFDNERVELDMALDSKSCEEVIHEAADLGNVTMMIADDARRLIARAKEGRPRA